MVKLGKGQMTDVPVKSQFGFHIIRVDDIRDADLPKLDDVKPQIAQQLQQQKLAKFKEDLRANPDGHPNSPTYGHVKLPHLN